MKKINIDEYELFRFEDSQGLTSRLFGIKINPHEFNPRMFANIIHGGVDAARTNSPEAFPSDRASANFVIDALRSQGHDIIELSNLSTFSMENSPIKI